MFGVLADTSFIAMKKVERMEELLVTTDKKCFEIAHELKFAREDVAARFFRRMTGMTNVGIQRAAPQRKKQWHTESANLKCQPQMPMFFS